jgi:hypothetical protein
MTEPAVLFVLLFAAPALIFAVVFAAIALKAPRGGAVLCGMLLASVAPLLFGVDRVGFLRGAGPWLGASVVIAAAGLVVALVGLARQTRKPAATPKDN